MRYITCVLAAFCISASMTYAADSPKLTPAEQELVTVSKTRLEALNRGDIATYSRYTADDLIHTDDDGSIATKAQVIKENSKVPHYVRSADARDYVVHLHGDTAVVNNRLTIHEQVGDADIVTEVRRTETYIKKDGNWQAIAVQQTDLPINHRKPVAIDPGMLKDYAGQYQARPGEVDTVSVKDGKLWSQIGAEPDEILPAGRDAFFFKDDLGSETYTRDTQGHVNGYTYTHADGQQSRYRKIK